MQACAVAPLGIEDDRGRMAGACRRRGSANGGAGLPHTLTALVASRHPYHVRRTSQAEGRRGRASAAAYGTGRFTMLIADIVGLLWVCVVTPHHC
jgi:hypothetical protein